MKRVVLASAAVFLIAAPAYGVRGDGQIEGGGEVVVEIEVGTPGREITSENALRPLIKYDIEYQVTGDRPARPGDLSGWCLASGDAQAPVFGFQYWIIGTALSGQIVVNRLECVPFVDGDPTRPPAPPVLPQPPTVGEAWDRAQLPPPAIVLDPAGRGITGLETRISTAGPTSLIISAAIRGYTITGAATLEHYTISIDGEPPVVAASHVYTFETKGIHRVTVGAVWRGTATITGPDLPEPIALGDIGTATITATRDYRVNEVRSVLQP